jgi:hypothetical protein
MQEGIQLPELMKKIKALREAGLRAEHVAFNFMKRRVQPLMARDTLGYQYTGDEDTLRIVGVFDRQPTKGSTRSMNVASPRSVTRRKRHVAHNLDRFGPRGA